MDLDDTLQLLPDYRNYLIYCDEASIQGGERYYGWGTVWIPAEARGRLSGLFADIRSRHFLSGDEVKWSKVNRATLPYFRALLEAFFRKDWLLFHCIIVDTRIVRTDWFPGGLPEARLHHFSTFLRTKIGYFSPPRAPRKLYHVRVDPLPSSYAKEDEKLWKITDAMLRQKLGDRRIASLLTRDSKLSRGIQLVDFLLGAVLCPWNGNVDSGSPKAILSKELYEHLGWSDHLADTDSNILKFNIWHFYDEKQGLRTVHRRKVEFKYPVRAYRALDR